MKNRFLRYASILMALVLMTSCFVGGTFAKYVAAGNADDSARVAKFGVVISASDNAFSTEYETTDDEYSETLSVKSDVKVVAPGTEGEFATIELSGTPEVAVEISYSVELSFSDAWVNADGDFYFPIDININNIVFVGSAYDNPESLKNDIARYISNNYTAQFAPGTDLSSANGDLAAFDLSWRWPYESELHLIPTHQNDIDDTYLGDQAADGNAAEFSIKVDVTVTQID